jgi:Fic family protein
LGRRRSRLALQKNVPNPFERATAFFLFGSLQPFFFDGNRRTSRCMMNGALTMEGIDAISIAAMRAAEFNSKMVEFYITRDAPAIRQHRFDDPLPQVDRPAHPAEHG